jgi:hypothetical protein
MALAVRNSSHAFNIAGKHDTFSRNSKKYSGGLDYIIFTVTRVQKYIYIANYTIEIQGTTSN